MALTRLLARPLLASTFVFGGINALRHAEGHAQQAKPVTDKLVETVHDAKPDLAIPEDPKTLVRINAAAQIVGGLALATGRFPRLSSLVLAGSVVPTTAAGHRFWEEKDPAQRNQQLIHFLKNASILGGLILAATDTEGKPGVAWRAGRAAKDARREAKRLAHDAALETKLAKAKAF
ncbi:DoxX family protein [Nocardioides mangrovicus]|uniref:DoxX family protein n=1 Tax=Nocardioides mangrovicus TaxID=2478913 RepID=A0A3L8P6N5_9ACTN|nr:DoxX family protein [Nocardioides mangrovicus]RLV50996.1 DoxX family protein [Nocardioides mangrovicus]